MKDNHLDWGKITTFEQMQRLVNDLFAFESNMLEFIPSSPEIGADGGFDGLVDGAIPFLGISSSKTMLQTKYFRNHLEPAKVRDKIKTDLEGTKSKKGEIQKATEKGCKTLILATNGKLKPEYVKELENLKPKDLNKLVIMGQERLRTQIIQHQFLLLYYFNRGVHPTFVPPKIYLENKEKSLSDFNLALRLEHISSGVKDFIESNEKSILYLHAPGGYGKSHVISKIAYRELFDIRDREILFVDNSYRPFEQALEEEIVETSGHKYMVIFDDIDRDMNAVEPLFKLLSSGSNIDLKLIISSRSSSQFAVERELIAYQLRSKVQTEALVQWEDSELEKILKHFNPKIDDAKAKYIIRQYRNPYVVSWVGQKMRGESLEPKDLHDKLFNQLTEDIKQALTGLSLTEQQIDKFLVNTLSIIPFTHGHKATYKSLARILGVEEDLISDIFNRLIEVGIMRIVAGQLRINPDLKGDIALQYMINQRPKSEMIAIFKTWAGSHLNNLLFNINSASYYGKVDRLNDFLEEEVNSWIVAIENDEPVNVNQLLKYSEYIARILPEQILRLFELFVEKSDEFGLTTDNLGPLMKILGHQSLVHKEVLRILINKYHSIKEGTYSNYKVDDVSKGFLNPLPKYNSFKSLDNTVDFYDKNKDSKSALSAKTMLTSLSELLAGSHEHEESYGVSITFGRRTLKKDNRLITVRKKALEVILYFIRECDEVTFIFAFESADKIGESIGSVGTVENELYETFIDEQESVIKYINLDKIEKLSIGAKVKLEDFLFEWWAQEKGGSEEALKLIRSMKRDSLFYVVKSVKSRKFVGKDLDSFLKYKPEKRIKNSQDSRWSWFVNATFDQEYEAKAIKNISEDLTRELKTSSDILSFLNKVADCLDSNDWKPYAFINFWVPLSIELFIEVHQQKWDQVPIIFKPAIESAIVLSKNDYLGTIVQEYRKNIGNKSRHEISVMLEGVAKLDAKKFYEVCRFVINTTKIDSSAIVAAAIWMYYRQTKEANNTLLLINHLLSKHKRFTHRSIDYVQFVLTDILKEEPDFEFPDSIRNTLIRLLKRFPQAEHDFSAILNSLSPSLEELVDIVDFRLRLQQKCSAIRYSSLLPTSLTIKERVKRATSILKKHISFLVSFPYEYIFLRSELKNFDAFPHHGLTDIKIPINAYTDYEYYLNFLNDSDSKRILGLFDIDRLSSNIVMIGKEENPPWYKKYLKKVLSEKAIHKVISLLEALAFSKLDRSEACSILDQVFRVLVSDQEKQSYRSMLWSKAISGEFSSAIGKTPPQLIEKKQLFTELRDGCSLEGNKKILDDMVNEIQNQIDSHNTRDEDILYER